MLFLHQNATGWKVQFLCEASEGGPLAPTLPSPFNSSACSRPPLRPECTLESPEQTGNLLQTFFFLVTCHIPLLMVSSVEEKRFILV